MAGLRGGASPTTGSDDRAASDLTLDSFHRGGFVALQPSRFGHRSGSDALLLAAALPHGAKGRLADLGSGAGVAALAALSVNPGLHATLVEIDPVMAAIARKTLRLPENATICGRAEVMEADVTLTGDRRTKSGLRDNSFDHVIMNPPYNHPRQRPPDDPARALAHMMGTGGLEPWMRTASAILRPGGWLFVVYRSENLGEVIATAQGRFGGLAVLPLHARKDLAASRVIIRARRGSRAPLSIHPGIVLHDDDHRPTPLAEAALNGRLRLF